MTSWPCHAARTYGRCSSLSLCSASGTGSSSSSGYVEQWNSHPLLTLFLCLHPAPTPPHLSYPSLPSCSVPVCHKCPCESPRDTLWSNIYNFLSMNGAHFCLSWTKPTLTCSRRELLCVKSLLQSGHLKTCIFCLTKWVSKWTLSNAFWVKTVRHITHL